MWDLFQVVVGVTNLVPTFGPIVGGVIGGFILLMVKPFHALIFIIFIILLQTVDGYIIKPKLFGNTLGISGLLILLFILVGGSIWGNHRYPYRYTSCRNNGLYIP